MAGSSASRSLGHGGLPPPARPSGRNTRSSVTVRACTGLRWMTTSALKARRHSSAPAEAEARLDWTVRAIMNQRWAMRYKIALLKTDEGYSVSVPGLPGCWSQGATEEEALANIEDAIREYLEVAAELLRDSEVREVEVQV